MAVKKSELFRKIWKMCDELRGSMDASQYKDYILTILFVKYVSDKHGGKESLIDVPKGGSFQDMVELKGKPGIGDGINKIIQKLADENGISNLFEEVDFDNEEKLGSGQDMVDRLSDIIGIFQDEELDFTKNRVDGDDILGDVYEYLMRHFATESGKSKGQFYTPAEVSRVISKVIGINQAKRKDQTLYDPTCGSGSLLLKAAHESQSGVTIYGQENDMATRAMAVMNMWLHEYPDATIIKENTISKPQFLKSENELETFDFAVANPPFSTKSWTKGIIPERDNFKRFDGFGIPPKKNGDFTFLLHMIKSLKPTGKGAIILPHGVLFRGNVESEIRKNIIECGYIQGVIGLPPNLFYGTSIPACIIILDKEESETRENIFIIDASKGFIKDGNKNRLRARDIHRIVDVFTELKEIPKFSRMVPKSEIINEENDYNLNISRYIDAQEEEDIQDIEAHLKGDIPSKDIQDLENYWKVYPSVKEVLFSSSKRKGYVKLKVKDFEIKSSIFEHDEFKKYSKKILKVFSDWKNKHMALLKGIKSNSKPHDIIKTISEDFLENFSKLELIDGYDIYQNLMDYWENQMQDDVYLIIQNSWNVEIKLLEKKKGKKQEWESELISKQIAIEKYFEDIKNQIESLKSKIDEIKQQKQIMEEENEEEDLFSETKGKSGKISKKELTIRTKLIINDPEFIDELKILRGYQKLMDEESEVTIQVEKLEKDLDNKLLEKYKNFSEDEIAVLVVEDKWFTSLEISIVSEMERISNKLTTRILDLLERYETPLPILDEEIQMLTKKVDANLEKMGFKWK